MSISSPVLEDRSAETSIDTIDRYGTALFGAQWQDSFRTSAAQVKELIDSNAFIEFLNSDDVVRIVHFRINAMLAGRPAVETWLNEKLEETDLPALSLAKLDWFDAPTVEETEPLFESESIVMAAPMTSSGSVFMDANGVVVVQGTDGSDTVTATTNGDALTVMLNGSATIMSLASATSFDIDTMGGNDVIFDDATDIQIPLVIDGGTGMDTIYASNADATIDGGEGADRLYGGRDLDSHYILRGNDPVDDADGPEGNQVDQIHAGAGSNAIWGDGTDWIYAGDGTGNIVVDGVGAILNLDFTAAEAHILKATGIGIEYDDTIIRTSKIDDVTFNLGPEVDTLLLKNVSNRTNYTLLNPSGDPDIVTVKTGSGSAILTSSSIVAGLRTINYVGSNWKFNIDGYLGDTILDVVEPEVGALPSISFYGPVGTNTLNIDKTARTTNQTVTIDNTMVDIGSSTIDYSNVANLNVTTGDGDDVITLTEPPTSPSLPSSLSISSGSGTDALTLEAPGQNTVTATPSQLTLNGASFGYSDLESVILEAGAGENSFEVSKIAGGTVPTINWSYSGLPAGRYQVLASWESGGGTLVPITVTSDGTDFVYSLNFQSAPASAWYELGIFDVATGTLTVSADGSGDSPITGLKLDVLPAGGLSPLLSTPSLDSAYDTGVSSSDNVTSNSVLVFNGLAATGAQIEILSDGIPVGTGNASGGTYQITTSAIPDGRHVISARETSTSLVSGGRPLTIDSTAPSAPPAPSLVTASDSGISSADDLTNVTMPTFTGSAEPGSTVSLYSNDQWAGETIAAGGVYYVVLQSPLSSGAHQITVRATDAAGNESTASAGLPISIDTTPSAAPPAPTLDPPSDSGAQDLITNVVMPTFTGTVTGGSVVQIYSDGNLVATADVTGGNYSVQTNRLAAGIRVITARVLDDAGNLSSDSVAAIVEINPDRPAAPSAPVLDQASDSGVSDTDQITNVTTPTFIGTAGSALSVTLFVDGVSLETAPVVAGAYSITATTALWAGTHTVTAQGTDVAGNVSLMSAANIVTILSSPPIAAPPRLAPGEDTGSSNVDGVTKKNSPQFTGAALPGSSIELFSDGISVGTDTAIDGVYTIQSATLADGPHAITVKATDSAGNVSQMSDSTMVIVDTALPSIPATPALDSGNEKTFIGTADAGTIVTILAAGVAVGSAITDDEGNYSVYTASLTHGTHTITATATIALTGAVSDPSPSVLVSINAPSFELSDGGIILDSESVVDLGTTPLANAVTRTFAVTNTGNADLVLYAPDLPVGFSLLSPFSTVVVAPSASTSLTVQLDAQTPGSYGGTVTIGSNDSATAPFTFTLQGEVLGIVNHSPVVEEIDDQGVDAFSTLTFQVEATDPDNDALSYSLGPGAPDGADIDANGDFSWTPSSGDIGDYNITVVVTDDGSPALSASVDFGVTVYGSNQAPAISPILDQTVLADSTLSFPVFAEDPDNLTSSLVFSFDDAPPGASVDGGVFSWTPPGGAANTSVSVTIRGTDPGNQSDTVTFDIDVGEVPAPVTLPQVAGLQLVNDTETASDNITSDPRVSGTVTNTAGSVDSVPVQYDLNNDNLPDGQVVTNELGNGQFVIDLNHTLILDQQVNLNVRAGVLDESGTTFVFGGWEPFSLTYERPTPASAEPQQSYVPPEVTLATFETTYTQILQPSVTVSAQGDPTGFVGVALPGMSFVQFGQRFDGPTTSEDTTNVIDDSFHYPPIGGNETDVTGTVASVEHIVTQLNPDGSWVIDTMLVSSYLIVTVFAPAGAGDPYTLTQSGNRNYTFHASGDDAGATYWLQESGMDEVLFVQNSSSSSSGETQSTSYTSSQQQRYSLTATGVGIVEPDLTWTTSETFAYQADGTQTSSTAHTETSTTATSKLALTSHEEENKNWNYSSAQLVTVEAGGTTNVIDDFTYSYTDNPKFDTLRTKSSDTTTSVGGITKSQSSKQTTTTSGAESITYTVYGTKSTIDGVLTAAVTDKLMESDFDVFDDVLIESSEGVDASVANSEVTGKSSREVITHRTRSLNNLTTGVTTTAAGGDVTYAGTTDGTATSDYTASSKATQSSSGYDDSQTNIHHSFVTTSDSTDNENGNVVSTWNSTVNVDAQGNRLVVGTADETATKDGGMTWDTTAKSESTSQITLGDTTTKSAGNDSSTDVGSATFNSNSQYTVVYAPDGSKSINASSDYTFDGSGDKTGDVFDTATAVTKTAENDTTTDTTSTSTTSIATTSHYTSKGSGNSTNNNGTITSSDSTERDETGTLKRSDANNSKIIVVEASPGFDADSTTLLSSTHDRDGTYTSNETETTTLDASGSSSSSGNTFDETGTDKSSVERYTTSHSELKSGALSLTSDDSSGHKVSIDGTYETHSDGTSTTDVTGYTLLMYHEDSSSKGTRQTTSFTDSHATSSDTDANGLEIKTKRDIETSYDGDGTFSTSATLDTSSDSMGANSSSRTTSTTDDETGNRTEHSFNGETRKGSYSPVTGLTLTFDQSTSTTLDDDGTVTIHESSKSSAVDGVYTNSYDYSDETKGDLTVVSVSSSESSTTDDTVKDVHKFSKSTTKSTSTRDGSYTSKDTDSSAGTADGKFTSSSSSDFDSTGTTSSNSSGTNHITINDGAEGHGLDGDGAEGGVEKTSITDETNSETANGTYAFGSHSSRTLDIDGITIYHYDDHDDTTSKGTSSFTSTAKNTLEEARHKVSDFGIYQETHAKGKITTNGSSTFDAATHSTTTNDNGKQTAESKDSRTEKGTFTSTSSSHEDSTVEYFHLLTPGHYDKNHSISDNSSLTFGSFTSKSGGESSTSATGKTTTSDYSNESGNSLSFATSDLDSKVKSSDTTDKYESKDAETHDIVNTWDLVFTKYKNDASTKSGVHKTHDERSETGQGTIARTLTTNNTTKGVPENQRNASEEYTTITGSSSKTSTYTENGPVTLVFSESTDTLDGEVTKSNSESTITENLTATYIEDTTTSRVMIGKSDDGFLDDPILGTLFDLEIEFDNKSESKSHTSSSHTATVTTIDKEGFADGKPTSFSSREENITNGSGTSTASSESEATDKMTVLGSITITNFTKTESADDHKVTYSSETKDTSELKADGSTDVHEHEHRHSVISPNATPGHMDTKTETRTISETVFNGSALRSKFTKDTSNITYTIDTTEDVDNGVTTIDESNTFTGDGVDVLKLAHSFAMEETWTSGDRTTWRKDSKGDTDETTTTYTISGTITGTTASYTKPANIKQDVSKLYTREGTIDDTDYNSAEEVTVTDTESLDSNVTISGTVSLLTGQKTTNTTLLSEVRSDSIETTTKTSHDFYQKSATFDKHYFDAGSTTTNVTGTREDGVTFHTHEYSTDIGHDISYTSGDFDKLSVISTYKGEYLNGDNFTSVHTESTQESKSDIQSGTYISKSNYTKSDSRDHKVTTDPSVFDIINETRAYTYDNKSDSYVENTVDDIRTDDELTHADWSYQYTDNLQGGKTLTYSGSYSDHWVTKQEYWGETAWTETSDDNNTSKETGDVNFLGMPTYETTGEWSYSYIETDEPPIVDGGTYTNPPIAVNPTPVGPNPLPGPGGFSITFGPGDDTFVRLVEFSIDVGNQIHAAFTTVYDVFADGTAADFVLGFAAGFVNTVAIPLPYVEPWQPEPLYGHVDAFNYGQVAGVVAGVATSITVGVVASGGVGVLHAGVTLTKAAQLYTVATTVGGAITSGLNVYDTGKVGVGDALNLAAPAAFGVGKLARAVRAPCTCSAAKGICFATGTLVATENDQTPIERVTQGEYVWSCDLSSGEWRLCRVAETYVFDHVGELIEVFVAGAKIESTYHHPYWVIEGRSLDERPCPDHVASAMVPNATIPGRWVDAGDLRVGDVLLLMDGRRQPIVEILVRHVEEKVYNLAIDSLQNYAVGPERILVHNNCAEEISLIRAIKQDPTGKVHTPRTSRLPRYIPRSTPMRVLEDAASALSGSIGVRTAELLRLGEHGAHRARIGQELDVLREILKVLSNT